MTRYTSFAVFLLFSIALVVPSGYSFGAGLLLAGSAAFPWLANRPHARREDYLLIAVFALYFLVQSLINLVHDEPLRVYDLPTRFVLAIPVLFLLRAYPPEPGAFWSGVALGAIAAGLLSLWDVLYLGSPRAIGFSNATRYGNVSMLLGILCFAGLGWAATERYARRWGLLLVCGALFGILAAVFSATRSSWVALLVCLAILYFFRARVSGNRATLIGFCLLLVILATLYFVPRTGVQERVTAAISEVRQYVDAGNASTSVGARLEMWRMGLGLFSEKPWIGWGRSGYKEKVKQLVADEQVAPIVAEHLHTHNEFIDSLAKKGVPGLLSVLLLFFGPMWLFVQRYRFEGTLSRPFALAGILVCVSYAVIGLTQVSLLYNGEVTILAFLLTVLWSLANRDRSASVAGR